MTGNREVSVVIASLDRPASLSRTLRSLEFQRFDNFDVIVVARASTFDHPTLAHFRSRVAHVAYEEANISYARNLGLQAATGHLIAFIDDDAVAEPSWLSELRAAFDLPNVSGAGGFVIGRNGVSFQWKALASNADATDLPLTVAPDALPHVPSPPPGAVLKTSGTNAMFRADALRAIGGFDPNYHFYLDETDLTRRLASAGHRLAIAPRAIVHHAYASSTRRRADRVPQSLHEVAASSAYFWRRHLDPTKEPAARTAFLAAQQRRLDDVYLGGRIDASGLRQLRQELMDGLADGAARLPGTRILPGREPQRPGVFAGNSPGSGVGIGLIAGKGDVEFMRHLATKLSAAGAEVTLLDFRPGLRFLKVVFQKAGFWLHRGGIQGRAARTEPLANLIGLKTRVQRESARIATVRKFDALIACNSNVILTTSHEKFCQKFKGRHYIVHKSGQLCLNFAIIAGLKELR